MKICFLAPANSIHSYKWIKRFAEKGHEVHWVSIYPLEFPPIEGVTYHEFQHRSWTKDLLKHIIQFRKLVLQIKPDIVHVHSVAVYGTIAALSGFHPLVATAWGSDVLVRGNSFFRKPFVKHVLRQADLVTCDADHMVEAMVNLGVSEDKTRVVYFGVDTGSFSPGKKSPGLSAQLGLGSGPVIISLRSLSPIYDVGSLIQAIPKVAEAFPNITVIIAGTGPSELELRDLASNLGVMKNIQFVGRVENNKLPELLRIADLYVSTSLSDAGIAASTAEAMACGLPGVITDSGENRKWVVDGEGGHVVPVRSPSLLAERIIQLLRDKKFAARCAATNRRTIESRNDYYREMDKMDAIYAELQGSASRTR